MGFKRMLLWGLAAALLVLLGFGAGVRAGRRYSSLLGGGVADVFVRSAETAHFHWNKSDEAYQEQGRELYNSHCSLCHGAGGTGGRAPALRPSPEASDRVDSLTSIIQQGVPGSEMPAFEAILSHRQSFQIVAYLLAAQSAHVVTTRGGNPAAGAGLVREKGHCLQCHIVEGEGVALGPELTNIGLRLSSDYLRQKLQNPGKTVTHAYRPVEVIDKDGAAVRGFRQNEDTFSIQLLDVDKRTHSFWKQDVKEVRELENESFMPSYEHVFSEAELDDVVAYLVSLGA